MNTFSLTQSHTLPVVSINQVNVNNNTFSWILISRRSVQRAGTRLFSRGIDTNGFCSNFVETEQIVEFAGDKASFVQTRGSIPLYWAQTPNLKYKPKPQIDFAKDHLMATTKHIDTQLLLYGRQVLVNLVRVYLISFYSAWLRDKRIFKHLFSFRSLLSLCPDRSPRRRRTA